MARKTPSRPTLRPTSPDVANALRSLDPEPAVVTTPVRANPAYPGEPGSLADIGRKRFEKEQSERLGADAPKPKFPVPTPEPIRTTANLSVSIATAMRDRIDELAYQQKLGKTAIVEGALSALFEGRSNEQIAKLLRDKGQAFRRRS